MLGREGGGQLPNKLLLTNFVSELAGRHHVSAADTVDWMPILRQLLWLTLLRHPCALPSIDLPQLSCLCEPDNTSCKADGCRCWRVAGSRAGMWCCNCVFGGGGTSLRWLHLHFV